MENIRVAIIEDDQEIRELMRLIIDGSPGFYCKEVFEDCEKAIPVLLQSPPDIILMDIDLPGMSGIEGVRKIRETNGTVPLLMLTVHEDSESIFKSLCAGANGYLVKGMPPVKLLEALREAHQGGAPMSPLIANKVVKYFHQPSHQSLTKREMEVLQLLCEGENYSTISEQLYISKNTVKGHIKRIYSKLHVHTRAEAVLKAHKSNLIK